MQPLITFQIPTMERLESKPGKFSTEQDIDGITCRSAAEQMCDSWPK